MAEHSRSQRRMHPPRGLAGARPALLALLMAVLSLPAWPRPIRFVAVAPEAGLSQVTVNSILQDSRGFLWVATEDGLNRFDGYEFAIYKNVADDPRSLPADAVWTIAEDADGDLWVATEGGGVARWDHRTDRFVRYVLADAATDATATRSVRVLHLDPSGTVWIGTRTAGLWRLDPATGEATSYRHDPDDPVSLADDAVFVIAPAGDGKLWVGTEGGLDRFDPASSAFEHFRHQPERPESLSDDRIRALLSDRSGQLWVGTYGGGVDLLRPSQGGFRHLRHDDEDPGSLPHDRVRSLLEDDDGRLWVGTAGGLCLLDPRQLRCEVFRHDPLDPASLANDDVTALFQDRGGVLWFGTRFAGLMHWHPNAWSFGHVPPAALSSGTVTAFAEDAGRRLWVATLGGGLNRIDRTTGETTVYRADPGAADRLGSDFLSALDLEDPTTLWVGTFDHGLYRLDLQRERARRFAPDPDDPNALGAEGVTSLLRDSRGTLWVGTFGAGVHRFDAVTERFTRYAEELSSPRAICLAEGRDGRIWIGTDGGGLDVLDRASRTVNSFRHDPDDPTSLPADTVFSLHVSADGTVWAGTRGGGLARLEEPEDADGTVTFHAYGEPQGLPNEVVYGILESDSGELWLSTNRGLASFDPRTETVHSYDASHGLQGDEFGFGAHFRSPTGELFFGGADGFNAFFPHQIAHNEQPPPLVLTGVFELGRPLAGVPPPFSLEALQLGYRDDVVTFEFAALDFAAAQRNVYAYRLEGFDDDWIELGRHRRVTYTDLDGGEYVLRVKGANNDGVWNETGLSLAVHVDDPPWKTGWAYTGYGLLAVAGLFLVYGVHRRRLGREEEYSRRLEHEVDKRTEELGERNRSLELLNAELESASLTDPLTGLWNRRYLFRHVAEEISLVERRYDQLAKGVENIKVFDLVFMVVDLDHFKSINDTCGHQAGDRVLVQVKALLEANSRTSDILVRWGGDEFLVIGRDASPQQGQVMARRVHEALAGAVFELDDGQVVKATCSIGFACFPFVREAPGVNSWEDVLALADAALYAAKNSGRNSWLGIVSTATTPTEDLLPRLRHDPQALVEQGAIEISTSLPEGTEIQWS